MRANPCSQVRTQLESLQDVVDQKVLLKLWELGRQVPEAVSHMDALSLVVAHRRSALFQVRYRRTWNGSRGSARISLQRLRRMRPLAAASQKSEPKRVA
eukprot:2030866-Amphidinium_carterae.2